MKKLRLLSLLVLMTLCTVVSAHDFTIAIDGQKVYFNILNKSNKTVEITYNGSIVDKDPTYYEGELKVPSKVKYNGTVYTVVGIGPKAFAGADKLTAIELPMGVDKIGDFAFEGCTSLAKIIFPGNVVKFGQGVFFKCDKIQNVSFGSEWTEVNLKMFRWSDSLKVVNIPAKMEKILNSKSVKKLEIFAADVNNSYFTTLEGVLYSADKETFLSCPRAYKGKVVVADGTKNIAKGAFNYCNDIVSVDLPESIESMSFRTFFRMSSLNEIIIRNQNPIATAKISGEEVFLLQVSNPELELIVSKSAKKAYKKAMNLKAGEYTDLNEDIPYFVELSEMPNFVNLVTVRKF